MRVEDAGHQAHIWVQDRGVGIPAEALGAIFGRFHRVEDGVGGAAGFGIGLYVSKSIIELHGGRIEVCSELGHGSTFSVTLPVHNGHSGDFLRRRLSGVVVSLDALECLFHEAAGALDQGRCPPGRGPHVRQPISHGCAGVRIHALPHARTASGRPSCGFLRML